MKNDEKDHSALAEVGSDTTVVPTPQLTHDATCSSRICRWCDIQHEPNAGCEFDGRLCDCVVDLQRARELTPSGFTVTDWLQETGDQFADMKSTFKALLAELRRCDEAGERIDMQSDLIVHAFDRIDVIWVTQRELEELSGYHGKEPVSEASGSTQSEAQK